MKNLLFLLVFLFTTVSHSQSIVFEPVGDMDKPLPTISVYISDNQKPKLFEENDEFAFSYFLEEKSFSILKKTIDYRKTNNSTNIDPNYDFGAYRIIYTEANGKQTLDFILPSHKESYIFFKEILPLVSSNHYLHEKIEMLIQRLNH